MYSAGICLSKLPRWKLQSICFVLTIAVVAAAGPFRNGLAFGGVFASRQTHRTDRSTLCISKASATAEQEGLYRPFVEHAWNMLQSSGLFVPINDLPSDLLFNSAPAKGMPPDSVVQMQVKAMTPTENASSVVRYARYALLETLVPSSEKNSTAGIQIMNLVVFPSQYEALPVWGVDLVSLPGGRHLLAMDVQPMSKEYEMGSSWDKWHEKHVQDVFEWGGDVPEEAGRFFSKNALWTRLKGGENATSIIQTKVWDAFCEHLELYLEMLNNHTPTESSPNVQKEYLQYRLQNDPARPMLQSLYGPEWTEEVLETVLFPSL